MSETECLRDCRVVWNVNRSSWVLSESQQRPLSELEEKETTRHVRFLFFFFIGNNTKPQGTYTPPAPLLLLYKRLWRENGMF